MADDNVTWRNPDGSQVKVTGWSRRLYLFVWAMVIVWLVVGLIAGVFLYVQFQRFDALNVVERVASLPDKLDLLTAAIKSVC